ncbi:MAG TPA: peptidase S8 [Kosmotogaceae bacterium]|nr:peptidase S8 [Kosmotogaceae bacterium]
MRNLTKAVFAIIAISILFLFLTGCPLPVIQPVSISGQIRPYTGSVVDTSRYWSSTSLPSYESGFLESVEGDYVPGEFILIIDSSFSTDYVIHALSKSGTDYPQISKVVETADGSLKYMVVRAEDDAYRTLESIPGVLSVERNYIFRALTDFDGAGTKTPNDPLYINQKWHYEMINLPEAWSITTGSQLVVVAVIDSGVDFSHPDLQGVFYDTGWDFVDKDAFPQDLHGHGTHVAGTIAALTNNGEGVAGVAWGGEDGVKILPIRVLNEAGRGTADDVFDGIIYAVEHGARIINLSLGAPNGSKAIWEAVQYAYRNDVVVIAAAGNYKPKQSTAVNFPAAYSETVAVGAVGPDGLLTSYSCFGPEVDVVAPGGSSITPGNGVLSTAISDSLYEYDVGTSMAAPHVAGLVALLMTRGISGVENIRSLLQETAEHPSSLPKNQRDDYYGYGIVDAHQALMQAGIGEPFYVLVYDVGLEEFIAETITDEYGRFSFNNINARRVQLYAIKLGNDLDDGVGDLFGYYGYSGGDPRSGSATTITVTSGGSYNIDFYFAPIATRYENDSQSLTEKFFDIIREVTVE